MNSNIIVDSSLIDLNALLINLNSILSSKPRFEICRIKMLSGLDVDFYYDDLVDLHNYLSCFRPLNTLRNNKFVKLYYYIFHESARLYNGEFEIL